MLKRNRIKYKLIEKHIEAVKSGKYVLAKNLLLLLRKRSINVGLNDIDFELECIAEETGCRITYSRNYNGANIRF